MSASVSGATSAPDWAASAAVAGSATTAATTAATTTGGGAAAAAGARRGAAVRRRGRARRSGGGVGATQDDWIKRKVPVHPPTHHVEVLSTTPHPLARSLTWGRRATSPMAGSRAGVEAVVTVRRRRPRAFAPVLLRRRASWSPHRWRRPGVKLPERLWLLKLSLESTSDAVRTPTASCIERKAWSSALGGRRAARDALLDRAERDCCRPSEPVNRSAPRLCG